MKKHLLLITLMAPFVASAQGESAGNLEVIGAIVVLALAFLLFFLLRSVMLWYWRVDVIIKNQEKANELLSKNNALLNEQILVLRGDCKPTLADKVELKYKLNKDQYKDDKL